MSKLMRAALWAACAGCLGVSSSAFALKPVEPAYELMRGVSGPEALATRADGQYAADGRVVALFQPAFRARKADAETMAREFLAARHAQLGLAADELLQLEVSHRRDGERFSVVRFAQMRQGVPVYGSDVAVSVMRDGRVIYVTNDAVMDAGQPDFSRASRSGSDAIDLVRSHLRVNRLSHENARQVVYVDGGNTRLAWRVIAESAEVRGSWEVLIDADTGQVLRAEDKALYRTPESRGGAITGTIWTPDPLSSALATYGQTGFVDGNNADTPQLTGQLKTVELEDLTFSGGVYSLASQWVQCTDTLEAPTNSGGCPTSATGEEFHLTRSQAGFDGVMAYHHLNTMMKYVNETLGVTAVPINGVQVLRFDPHGLNGDDNSHFVGGSQILAFGEGGVDDAQDADVIVHELGHALHYFVTGGSLSQVQGLSEGTGDYVAGGYSRDYKDQWTEAQAPYFWTFSWDGHNTFWAGRVLNWQTTNTYAGIGGQSIHTAGQYWASCNVRARDLIGGEAMDRIFWEGLSMTGGSTNQKAAAQAVINAAAALGYPQGQINTVGAVYNTGVAGDLNCTYDVTIPQATDPVVDIDLAQIAGQAFEGASVVVPLSIANTGGSSLAWNIDTSDQADCSVSSSVDWISFAPTSGNTVGGSSTSVAVTLDADGLAAGQYATNLCVHSNDPETDVLAVPVAFDVIEDVRIFKHGFESIPAYFSEDFDSYANGSNIHGQGGWKGWGNDPSGGATVTNAFASSPANSINVAGDTDLIHEFDLTSGAWVLSAKQYIPAGFSGESYFIALSQYVDTCTGSPACLWAVQVNFSGGTLINEGASGGSLPYVTGQWADIEVTFDLDADTQTFRYNGQVLYTGTWTNEQSGGSIAALGALDLFANGASSIYYDDIRIMPAE